MQDVGITRTRVRINRDMVSISSRVRVSSFMLSVRISLLQLMQMPTD